MNDIHNEKEIIALNPVALAYMGDAVFEVFVRQKLVKNTNIHNIHKKSISMVCAKAQSEMYHRLLEIATDEEISILKRGRNSVTKVKKSSSVSEYRHATGLEALFGYLFLTGKIERLKLIFEYLYENKE
ncbi:MAG: ribonuclease III [Defluviitaleaceae bacterium]|nr:ribonuclease III [Defluviitaleaceae bacterium]